MGRPWPKNYKFLTLGVFHMLERRDVRGAVSAALALSMSTVIGTASADDQSPGQARAALQEILVTARRTEESLQDVPLSISALTGDEIASLGLRDLVDLSAYTPGFYARYQASATAAGRNDRGAASFIFRGFSIASGLVFVDGAPVTGGAVPEVYDVARVEVLKGPQSAYFGRSTFSGAVNFITREPGEEFAGRVSAEMATFNSSDMSVSLEGPLGIEGLAGRISGRYSSQGGHYTNAHDPGRRLGDRETTSVSGVLRYSPSDRLSIRVYGAYDRFDDGPPAHLAIKSTEMNCNTGGLRNDGQWWCGDLPKWNQIDPAWISGDYTMDPIVRDAINNNVNGFPTAFSSRYQTRPGLKRESYVSNLRIDWDLDNGMTLSSLTSYNTEKSMNIVNLTFRDGTDVPNPVFGAPQFSPNLPYIRWMVATQGESEDFSQEFRLVSEQDQRLRWLVGASYLELNNPGGTGVYGSTPLGNLVVSSTFRSRSSTPAVFGGVYFDITPALTVSGELRYQRDSIFRQALTTAQGAVIPGGGPRFNETFNSLAPRATVDWTFAEGQMAYVQFARGFRPGGFNTAFAAQPPEVQDQFPPGVGITFGEDRLDNFEIGLKSTWMDGRLQTRAAAYAARWRDGQQLTTLSFIVPGTGGVNIVSGITNVGAINLAGLELEGEFQATENLLLSGTLGYNDTDIREFVCGECRDIGPSTDVRGNQLQQTPKLEWSASALYARNVNAVWEAYSRLDITYKGSSYVTASNSAVIPSSNRVNLRLGIRNENLSVEIYGRNLTQDKAPLNASLGADALFTPLNIAGREIRYALPDKRMFGLRATYDF